MTRADGDKKRRKVLPLNRSHGITLPRPFVGNNPPKYVNVEIDQYGRLIVKKSRL